uniref:Uncharacterized protein n=1 Tax=viral metagenome TaxID=1070528 RepID=A0A6C0KI99_9ZZZZ
MNEYKELSNEIAMREYGDLYNRNLALHVILLRFAREKEIDHAEKEDLKNILLIMKNRSRKVHNFFMGEMRYVDIYPELADLLERLQRFVKMNVGLCDIISSLPVSFTQKTVCDEVYPVTSDC